MNLNDNDARETAALCAETGDLLDAYFDAVDKESANAAEVLGGLLRTNAASLRRQAHLVTCALPTEEGPPPMTVPVRTGIKDTDHVAGEALPCPFCGGTRIYIDHDPGEFDDASIPPRPTWVASCSSCASTGPWNKINAEAALTEWNRRS